MTGTLLRLASLACALATMLLLGLHVMGPEAPSEAAAHASHGTIDPGGQPADPAVACASHCIAAAVSPGADPGPEPSSRHALLPHAPVRLSGLAPQLLGPPPRAVLAA